MFADKDFELYLEYFHERVTSAVGIPHSMTYEIPKSDRVRMTRRTRPHSPIFYTSREATYHPVWSETNKKRFMSVYSEGLDQSLSTWMTDDPVDDPRAYASLVAIEDEEDKAGIELIERAAESLSKDKPIVPKEFEVKPFPVSDFPPIYLMNFDLLDRTHDFNTQETEPHDNKGYSGPKEDNHEGMIYNPYSDSWSWI